MLWLRRQNTVPIAGGTVSAAILGLFLWQASDPNQCVAAESAALETPTFESAIAPLFQSKCATCHGEDALEVELDVRSLAGLLKGGESGPAIVPGSIDESLLYQKVKKGEMPPERETPLTQAEIARIGQWIESGAGSSRKDRAESAEPRLNQHDVIPILMRRCTACHGRFQQEAGLDLRTKASILRGGKNGPAIVPGNADASLLLQKIRAGEMPPKTRLVEACVKPIEPDETETLARWIADSAPEADIQPDVATTDPDPLVSDKERQFWSFQPPKPQRVPQVANAEQVRNPIDAFVLAKLRERRLEFSPEADRRTLARRACLDLTGLPPSPELVESFVADPDPAAYEKLIDQLLASPRFGERWGRAWLDLAGYSDSEGKREQDLPRPHAWRYRDYVIRAMNADKPYDRFLIEQLAGDELADYESAKEVTPEIHDNLVATGFLRMAPDASWANITGYLPDRVEVVADEIDVLGSAVLGLTLKCARCHSHKFDPIPQRDYYRLVAVFKGAYDEYNWLKPDVRPGLGPVSQDFVGGRHLPHVTSAERRAWEEANAGIDRQIAEAKAQPDGDKRVKELEAQRPPEPRIQALWDQGDPSPTYIYRRGDPMTPGRLVGPGVPSVLTDGSTPFEVRPPWPGAKQTGRRLAFARWLTQPDQPLTARVAVNHLWKRHFGEGIVKTLGNFGVTGSPPTHPELLDWLAVEFIRQGWSMKGMHRLIMTSATYRQSSTVTPDRARVDPENALLSRMPMVRLDAEALYDSMLTVSGRLDERPGGPADPVEVRPDGLITPSVSANGWRRLVYVQQTRKKVPTHLETFDYPQMNPNCLERRESVVAPQALHLLNNGMVLALSGQFAERVRRDVGSDAARQVDRVHRLALGRPPTAEESRYGEDVLGRLQRAWQEHLASQGKADAMDAERRALSAYCHAMLNSASFLYVD